MNKLHASKEAYVTQCIDLLEGTYLRESGVMVELEKGLYKMSKVNLGRLYSVLLTRVTVSIPKREE